jgi:CheY-like chemotaxis protein
MPPQVPLVLLVEDDAGIRTVVRRLLELRGYGVVECQAANQALAIVESQRGRLSCMVVDYALPETNGVSLARRVRRMAPWIRTLVISGHRHIGKECSGIGGVGFLAKPFGTTEFMRAMQGLQTPPRPRPAPVLMPAATAMREAICRAV